MRYVHRQTHLRSQRGRLVFRGLAGCVALSIAACAPAVGPYEVRANQDAVACQQGNYAACQDYQAVAPYAAAEHQANAEQAQVNTGLAIGAVGILAGAAAIAATADDGGHDHGGGHGGGGHGGGNRGGGDNYRRH